MSERRDDRFQHARQIGQHIEIAEAKNAIAPGAEKRLASEIVITLRSFDVMPSVDLDDEPVLMTEEVDHVRADRGLSTKARATETMCPQGVPDLAFGIGHVPTERARARPHPRNDAPDRRFRLVSHDRPVVPPSPSPTLPRTRGRESAPPLRVRRGF